MYLMCVIDPLGSVAPNCTQEVIGGDVMGYRAKGDAPGISAVYCSETTLTISATRRAAWMTWARSMTSGSYLMSMVSSA